MARKYEKVQELLPIIKARMAAGKTQREIAEEFGLKDKYVIQQLLTRERRKDIAAQVQESELGETPCSLQIGDRRGEWSCPPSCPEPVPGVPSTLCGEAVAGPPHGLSFPSCSLLCLGLRSTPDGFRRPGCPSLGASPVLAPVPRPLPEAQADFLLRPPPPTASAPAGLRGGLCLREHGPLPGSCGWRLVSWLSEGPEHSL